MQKDRPGLQKELCMAGGPDNGAERVVWARKHVATGKCPKSYVSAQSLAWLEEFLVRRKLGQKWPGELGARETEAFLVLESEWEGEKQDG